MCCVRSLQPCRRQTLTAWTTPGLYRVALCYPKFAPDVLLEAEWAKGREGFVTKENSVAFGKSTSQRIYPKQHTPKIG